MKIQNKNTQLVNIRALAIILVVLGHSIILYSDNWDLYVTVRKAPVLNTLKQIIDYIQMPLFFAVSGYLFFYTQQKRNPTEILSRKFKRLIIPYFAVSLLYLLPIRLLIQYPSYKNMTVLDFIRKLITADDVGHLWYLPALFGVFLVATCILLILNYLTRSEKIKSVILLLIGYLLYFEGYKIGIKYPPLLNVYNYFIWFASGYCISAFSEYIKQLYKPSLVKCSLCIVWLCNLIYSLISANVRVLLLLALQSLFILNVFGITPEKSTSLISKIDKNSFGIYLFHSPLIYIVFSSMPNANPLLVVFINFFGFGAVAYYITELIRKVHLGLLIGE